MSAWFDPRLTRESGFNGTPLFTLLLAIFLMIAVLALRIDRAAAQEIALTPLEANEVAKGYRADALKLKPVVNDKNEGLGRIDDFVFSKDGNSIFVVLAVGDFGGLTSHLIAIPFRSLKLDESADNIMLPGATRAALQKLPVYVGEPVAQSSQSASPRR
ncbi:MAG: uncharacterized protein JWP25_2414 [Bradyrhizobium sp.]|nr:uncharacterized protein [Bradyrhizobium sp.]